MFTPEKGLGAGCGVAIGQKRDARDVDCRFQFDCQLNVIGSGNQGDDLVHVARPSVLTTLPRMTEWPAT